MKFASMLLNETPEEEEEELDLSSLFGGQQPTAWWPGMPAYYGQESRSVLIAGEIDEQVANSVIAQMQQLQADDLESPVRVYVNTLGGDAASAFALYDWMRCLAVPIISIAYGRCSSAGLPILMGGDFRLATPRCRFFYHEVVGGYGVTSTKELEEAAGNYTWYQETMEEILTTRAKINKRNWKKHFAGKTSFYFGSDFALEMGIIHDKLEEINKKVTISKE
jgi:ATP-dependent Clp endopeptidase proteolytic subunit ClpP